MRENPQKKRNPEKTKEQQPVLNIQNSLEQIPSVSGVQKVELDDNYFQWAKENLSPELYKTIQTNYESLQAHKFKYLSDGLSIVGYIWSPKKIEKPLPITVWNRGGTKEIAAIGEVRGLVYANTPCELAKSGTIVVASEYRGGLGSEGKDECGGADLHDVIQVKKIADQLPECQPGKAIVAGASRGGMMSYLLASKEPWVKAVIALSGLTDLVTLAKERSDMERTFRECFGGSDEEKKKRSATYFFPAIPKDLPIFIMHGSEDKNVSVRQARKFYELLRANNHTVEYHELPGADHFFRDVESSHRKKAFAIIEQFLKKQL